MVRALAFLICVLIGFDAGAACVPAQTLRQRELQDQFSKLAKSIDRAAIRVEGQGRRIDALPEALAARAPERPKPVDKFAKGFDSDGKIPLDCDNPEGVGALLDLATDGVADMAARLKTYEAEAAAREEALIALETEADGGPPPVAENEEPPPAAENEPPPSQVKVWKPLPVADSDLVHQRALALPGAQFHGVPGGAAVPGGDIPPFAVLYIFERKEVGGVDWLLAGSRFSDAPAGWTRADKTLSWNSALVMQFTPPGVRERVLFFKNSRDLRDIITSPFFAQDSKKIYEGLASPDFDAKRFVAIEPGTSVNYADQPYLLPITAHINQQFDSGTPTTLIQVASVSLQTGALAVRDDRSFEEPPPQTDLKGFKIGVAFVMDTTASMTPYINLTYQTIETFYRAFDALPGGNPASFGLVAYRDNFNHDSRIEYVTRVYQTLDAAANPRSVLANLRAVKASQFATIDWREDAYAGVMTAIEDFDWDPFQARLIFLITDAGAREGGDPMASRADVDARRITEAARQKNIAVIPIHLTTPEAERGGHVRPARDQYAQLGQETGDINVMKYLPIDARSSAAFGREIQDAADVIVAAIAKAAENKKVTDAPNDGDQSSGAPKVNDGDLTSGGDDPAQGKLGRLVASEILRAQLQYIGQEGEVEAPSFISGWAADRDLTDPERRTMEVRVFLTRNQLSALANSVQVITDAFKAAGKSPGAFFDELQLIAAKTSKDPARMQNDEAAAVREILPAFLRDLPYRSDVLRLNRQYWESISTADRQAFVEELESKLRVYRSLYDQTENWVDFGAGDPAQEAYPILLTRLP